MSTDTEDGTAAQLISTVTSEPLNRHTVTSALGTQAYTTANPLNQYPSVTPIDCALTAIAYDANG